MVKEPPFEHCQPVVENNHVDNILENANSAMYPVKKLEFSICFMDKYSIFQAPALETGVENEVEPDTGWSEQFMLGPLQSQKHASFEFSPLNKENEISYYNVSLVADDKETAKRENEKALNQDTSNIESGVIKQGNCLKENLGINIWLPQLITFLFLLI